MHSIINIYVNKAKKINIGTYVRVITDIYSYQYMYIKITNKSNPSYIGISHIYPIIIILNKLSSKLY
jgi:hypothetical protein